MKCGDVKNYLTDYARGALAVGLREQVSLHLEGCPACHALLAEEERLAQLLAAEQPAEPSDTFWANFLPRVRERIAVRKKKRKSYLVRRWVYVTGSVAAILVLSLFAHQRWFGQNEPTGWLSQLPPGVTVEDVVGYVAARGGDGQLASAAIGADSVYIAGLVSAAQESLAQEGRLELVFHQIPEGEALRVLAEVERLKL